MKCAMCGKVLGENEIFFGEEGTEYAGLPLCKKCYFKHLKRLLYIMWSYLKNEAINYVENYDSVLNYKFKYYSKNGFSDQRN